MPAISKLEHELNLPDLKGIQRAGQAGHFTVTIHVGRYGSIEDAIVGRNAARRALKLVLGIET